MDASTFPEEGVGQVEGKGIGESWMPEEKRSVRATGGGGEGHAGPQAGDPGEGKLREQSWHRGRQATARATLGCPPWQSCGEH